MNDAIIFGTEEELLLAKIYGVEFISNDHGLNLIAYYYKGYLWVEDELFLTYKDRPVAEG